jgi:hypothetical protein
LQIEYEIGDRLLDIKGNQMTSWLPQICYILGMPVVAVTDLKIRR